MIMVDLVVIGGGVAGLMAVGRAALGGLNVLLLEKMEKPARKLRITGKGRCNLTNNRPKDEFRDKIPQGYDFVCGSLSTFDSMAVVEFMESIGVPLVAERGGRIFPASGKAWDVAQAMVSWAQRSGAQIRCNACVSSVRPGFVVELTTGEKIHTRAVIITTGGVSYPSTGSTGDGYRFAHDLGHSITPLRPALVPLDIDNIKHYTGLSLKNVGVKLIVANEVVLERFGDVDFTDRAMGGATILQLSRRAVDALIDGKRVAIEIDLKPALTPVKLTNRINREIDQLQQGATYKVLLQRLTPSPLFAAIAAHSGVKLDERLSELGVSKIGSTVRILKALRFDIINYRPFAEAIITAGGVALDEVNESTMESKIIKNLYFAGEVLDIDADTGGFNIQIALSTAHTAADSIIQSLK